MSDSYVQGALSRRSFQPQHPVSPEILGLIVEEATTRYNTMITLRAKPKIYSYTNRYDKFDFNVMLLAPPGTKVVTNDKP